MAGRPPFISRKQLIIQDQNQSHSRKKRKWTKGCKTYSSSGVHPTGSPNYRAAVQVPDETQQSPGEWLSGSFAHLNIIFMHHLHSCPHFRHPHDFPYPLPFSCSHAKSLLLYIAFYMEKWEGLILLCYLGISKGLLKTSQSVSEN